jgi:flagellar basal-body rod protein FlgF
MDKSIFVMNSGARAAMQRQEVLANNLANATTVGFRAELHAIRSVPVQGQAATTRAFALETTVGYSDAPGTVQATGRSLDVAARDRAWFAVQALDGTEAYTRAGGMDVNAQGILTLRNGLQVQGEGGPITIPPNAAVEIAADGTVSAKVANQPPAVVGKLKLVEPQAALTRGSDGLFRSADGQELPPSENARVQSGALEGSNVSPVEAMVAMISAARQFEQQMKFLQTTEKQEQSAAKLLSTTG